MSGLPEGVSRGPWTCRKKLGELWVVEDADGQNIGVFKSQDDAEYVVEIINHEV